MVSLRERKPRPSYSDIPAGLSDLSGSEDSESRRPSSNGFDSGLTTKAKVQADERHSPFFGDSSEFEPDKETESNDVDADEDVEMDEQDELDSPEPDTPEEQEQMSVTTPARDIITPAPSRALAAPRKSGASAFVHNDATMLSAPYRNLIKQSAARLTEPKRGVFDKAKLNLKGGESYRHLGVDSYPGGPSTPFGTRLKARPPGRGRVKVEVVDEPDDTVERRNKRQKRIYQVGRFVPLLSPWEVWEGEGWWPEMWDGGGKGKGKGKGKAGWKMRDEVKIGLDHVGRMRFDELELLSEAAAKPFLSQPADLDGNPWITCHLGPHDKQQPVPMRMFDSRRIRDFNNAKEGFIFSAGGPIWGLDWCPYPESKAADFEYRQYLAISTLPRIDIQPALGEKTAQDTPGGIQIWSMTPPADDGTDPGGMRCEMVLCVDGGSAMQVRWMPLGAWDEHEIDSLYSSRLPKLGIMAAVQLDGSVSFYSNRMRTDPFFVSNKDSFARGMADVRLPQVRLRQSLLKLDISDASCTCFDWVTATRLAVGLSDGHCIVWDVVEALCSGDSSTLLPSVYMTVSMSCIRSIAVGRCPPTDAAGQPCFSDDPFYLVAGSYDGTTVLVDMRDPAFPVDINRARSTIMTVAWASQTGSPLYADVDFVVTMEKVWGEGLGRGFLLSPHRGPVWDITTSDYHTMAVSGGSDGAVLLSNYLTGFRRRRRRPLLFLRLFEMDYDTHTGEYRMKDDFLPETMTLEAAAHRNLSKQKVPNDPSVSKTANWSPPVGIHRVSWHNGGGIGRAGLLASGTASGLGRIDFVKGMFAHAANPGNALT